MELVGPQKKTPWFHLNHARFLAEQLYVLSVRITAEYLNGLLYPSFRTPILAHVYSSLVQSEHSP